MVWRLYFYILNLDELDELCCIFAAAFEKTDKSLSLLISKI